MWGGNDSSKRETPVHLTAEGMFIAKGPDFKAIIFEASIGIAGIGLTLILSLNAEMAPAAFDSA